MPQTSPPRFRPHRKRKLYVCYDPLGDQEFYGQFVQLLGEIYDVSGSLKADDSIDFEDPRYMVELVEETLQGVDVTVVLCSTTAQRSRAVDWQILASLHKRIGLIGLNLPTNAKGANGRSPVPKRLFDNLKSGYALFLPWAKAIGIPNVFAAVVEQAMRKDRGLINNERPKRKADDAAASHQLGKRL